MPPKTPLRPEYYARRRNLGLDPYKTPPSMLELEREVNTLRDEVAALTRSLKKAIATVKDLQGRVDDLENERDREKST